jgi:DNA-binding CsgD family transcriptional regulator
MRGRDRELEVVRGMMRAAGEGLGGVLLVEGETGIGKTRLLEATMGLAADRGFAVTSGGVDRLPDLGGAENRPLRLVPPTGSPGAAHPANGMPSDPRPRLRGEQAGPRADGNALYLVDDLHAASGETMRRLLRLTRRPGASPGLWVLARSTTAGTSGAAEQLFALLEGSGAVRMKLQRLSDDAVVGMITDELGVPPDAGLAELAGGAGGSPLLLAELLGGLRDENLIQIDARSAKLLSRRVPQRVLAVVRRRLAGLNPRLRRFLQVGAVLGRSFQLDAAASLLGETSAGVLLELEAALAADILEATGNLLSFCQELMWWGVVKCLPVPTRRALHQQAGEFLLEHGASPAVAAFHLICGSGLCDPQALARLDQAARRLLTASPQTSARLATCAFTLTSRSDPARVPRMITAVEALLGAVHLTEAEAVVRDAFIGPVPAAEAARLRALQASILLCRGQLSAAARQANSVLGERELSSAARADAEYSVLIGQCATWQHVAEARDHAEAVLAAGPGRGDAAIAGALLAKALIAWQEGSAETALALAREAVQWSDGDPAAPRWVIPRLVLARLLIPLGLQAEAAAVTAQLRERTRSDWFGGCAALTDIMGGYVSLASGDAAGAVARTEWGLRAAAAHGSHLLSPLGAAVMATTALRAGDLRAAAQHIDNCPVHPAEHGMGFGALLYVLAAAQIAEAQAGPGIADTAAHGLLARAARERGVLLADPAAAPWLVRFGLSQKDREQAQAVSQAAQALADSNRNLASLGAAAAQARGLVDNDAEALRLAVTGHVDPWARASAAEDLGELLVSQAETESARSFEDALAGYERTGAVRDARRVRHRLRELGIRRRHFSYANRRASGWESLTAAERAISDLVVQGLTNQQVAREMFLSAHTVAFHLRQIYRKLDIGSRVDLARIRLERDVSGRGGPGPDRPLHAVSAWAAGPAPRMRRERPGPVGKRPVGRG